MTHCKECISYDICEFHQDMIADEFITFFPHNEDCPFFKYKANFVELERLQQIFIERYTEICEKTKDEYQPILLEVAIMIGNAIKDAKMDGERKEDE